MSVFTAWQTLSSVMGTTGGCFWGVELAFQRVPGVVKTSVGYTAGHDTSPTYNKVCSGNTGHTEAVQVGHKSVTSTPLPVLHAESRATAW